MVLRLLLRSDDDLGHAFGGDRESIDTGAFPGAGEDEFLPISRNP